MYCSFCEQGNILKARGATDELIEILIKSSLENLATQGVTQPPNIPWYNK